MIYTRAFSFTDDSTGVAFPSLPETANSSAAGRSLIGPHSLKTAGILFHLRTIQSSWYQELFQSSRNPLQDSSTYIWQVCQEMLEWSESFPDTLPVALKDFFDLELLYSYVFCLAPSCRVQVVSNYGKTLIFEYSIAYMQKIFPISRDPINKAFYTYHDALRVFFVGGQFIAVLADNLDQLLNNIVPYMSATPGAPPPPPLPRNFGANNVDTSIKCITHIKETLRTLGYRWDNAKALLLNFEDQSEPLLLALHRRKRAFGESLRSSQSPPQYIPQPGSEAMSSRTTEEWPSQAQSFTGFNYPSDGGC